MALRRRLPAAAGTPLTATGSGTLALNPERHAHRRRWHGAGRAANAVNVLCRRRAAPRCVGEPTLALTYSGTGAPAGTHVFAQIVDEARGVVIGNQATPIPVTLDGQSHTITRSLEAVAAWPAGANTRCR